MSAPAYTAQSYRAAPLGAQPIGRAVLDYEDRFLRRKVLTLEDGRTVLADLPQTTSLDHGGVLVTTTGEEIEIVAAAQPLLEITGPDMTRIAWHVGNRHTPCQIEANRLLIQHDHVIRDMLIRIGATVHEVTEPFTPEGGAYGMGRTHGHDHSHSHSHSHGPESHSHSHDHEHGHAHAHPHDHDHD
ncbi:urease accessory protein UreE [Puniceibacterium sediminis]|uniref:Urease accessory protein UreE n=1 Tax=Puniceibacterium sediminis TaxID=1608407 RepID=A0A238WZU2_9RHOB|nr:urease accessory protein UreE [Puniceibacterium sediminis]SNR51972.1 urease accessory protein [Puniceibacterium sediminis]